ncbi:MAG: hypothetical protein PHQ60_03190 [Sideroxydans sp.]|nr:hypothetical protein [Sideroxydans sp.]
MKKTVKYTLDSAKSLPLTKKQKDEIKELSEMPDRKIDYSDIPSQSEEFWKNAVSNPFYKHTKTLPQAM